MAQDWAQAGGALGDRGQGPRAPAGVLRRPVQLEDRRGLHHGDPAGIGGPEPGPAGHIRAGERSGVTLYVQVADLRASLDKSVSLGATVVAEPFDVPGGPTLAGITDPEGNPLMLVQA